MRTYSLFAIILLCVAIVLVDVISFYWLQSITQFIESTIVKNILFILFWAFTVGLVSGILILKIKIDSVPIAKKHLLISSLYGLTVSSFIPKIIFGIVISILYFTNYLFSETESVYIVPIVGLFSGFLPFFVILYAVFKTLYNFKVHHITIGHKVLPESFDGFKIVHISDLHLGSFNYRYHILDRAVTIINEWNADLILFTGDIVNNFAWELKGWERVLNKLSAKKGKYAVLGNHDYGDYSTWESPVEKEENLNSIKQFYKTIDFKLLLNEAIIVKSKEQPIALIGLENWGQPPFKQYGDLEKALEKVTAVPFKILLSHDPSHWDEEVAQHTDIALTLAGHTHGMQAGIKVAGRQWSPIKYKYKQWAGLYTNKDQYLYVTRGLGWLGFPGRIGMRPEITFIKLKCLEK